MKINSYQSMIAWVAACSGCGVVPEVVLETMTASKDVKAHKLPKRFSRNKTRLIWEPENSEKLRPLFDLLLHQASETGLSEKRNLAAF